MRLSPEHIQELQKLLKEQFNFDYTDEQTQEAGLAIMRFMLAKQRRKQEVTVQSTAHKSYTSP